MPARTTAGARWVLTAVARVAWRVWRLPILALLTLLEPVVRVVFSLAIVFGIIAALVFELSAVGPRFPFLGMLALSLGSGVTLVVYYGVLTLVSR